MYINDFEEYKCQNGMDTSWIPLDTGHFYLCMSRPVSYDFIVIITLLPMYSPPPVLNRDPIEGPSTISLKFSLHLPSYGNFLVNTECWTDRLTAMKNLVDPC